MKVTYPKRARATLLLASAFALGSAAMAPASAQQLDANGIGRTEVVRRDLDAKNEAIQVRVDFGPHAAFGKHAHPGVEIAYVLEGTMEYVLDGKAVTLKAGESLFIPAGAVHSARNLGSGNASELATYLVEKGKPILVLAK
ncbi:cupin domain-containing protein [Massilia sp. CF038]|uniref:cupin domain-containing protein n=1 Tax=Massilia sp. CF038 TaxID=1881045 RepID=UPI000917A7AC|nr:cupin domain-containing protein [Massilia sp. CF038]SHG71846.1 Cupin domain protein [Massilia sp. CF038]